MWTGQRIWPIRFHLCRSGYCLETEANLYYVAMNIYYILAVAFGAAALFCGYKGSTVDSRNSAEDAKRNAQQQTK